MEIKLTPIFTPTVIIFDLDETTHTVYRTDSIDLTPSYHTPLSLSTQKLLCSSQMGHCKWYDVDISPINKAVHIMHAIAREEFKSILDRVYEIKNTYGEKCPIAVKIITRGDYSENEIKQAWDKFYGDQDERFTKNLLPIEFFNRTCYKKNGVPIRDDEEDGEAFRKEELISEHFPRWQIELPGLEKSRVCLLDDDYKTTIKVKEHGFYAIHFPTDTTDRPKDVTFTKEGFEAFAAIHKLIDTAVGQS